MEHVLSSPLLRMIRTGMRQSYESRLGFRGLTLRRALAAVFCSTLNKYQAVSAIVSFACFCFGYYQFLKMTSAQELLLKKNSTDVEVWKGSLGFVIGVIGWRVWMRVMRLLSRWEKSLGPFEREFGGKLILLFLRAPGLTLSPILGAYICPKFSDVAGINVLCTLAACTFFIQLTHPCESDFGSVDMLEGIHLPMLPQLDMKFKNVLTSFIYYLRKFVLLGVEETIKWVKRRWPESQQVVQPENIDVAQEPTLQQLTDLTRVTTEFLTVALTDGTLFVALSAASEHGLIEDGTEMKVLEKMQEMSAKIEVAQLHLANVPRQEMI